MGKGLAQRTIFSYDQKRGGCGRHHVLSCNRRFKDQSRASLPPAIFLGKVMFGFAVQCSLPYKICQCSRSGATSSKVKCTRFIITPWCCQKPVPAIRAKQGPGSYPSQVHSFLFYFLCGIPNLFEPA